MLRQLLQPVIRNTRNGVRSYHVPKELRPPTLDEAIVPCGSWQESYNKAQRRYNGQLVAGIALLLGTIAVGKSNGTLWFAYYPPKPKTEGSK